MTKSHAFAALALSLVLVGCSTVQTAPPTSAPKPTVEVTPTAAAQERETGLVAPAQVFGGSCDALFTAAELGEAIGIPVTGPNTWQLQDGGTRYVEQHGGIRCSWSASGFAASVSLIALPESAVDYAEPTGCGIETEGGSTGCSLEATENGVRLSGAVFRTDNDLAALGAAQTSLLDLFAQRAQGANVAVLPLPAAGSWAWPVDCATVVAAGDFSAVPGLGGSVTGGQTGGSDAYFVAAENALWGGFVPPYCEVGHDQIWVYFSALGGGRWTQSEVSAFPGSSTIAVAGIDSVLLSPGYGDTTRVDVYDGPNWVTFNVRYASNAGSMAAALVAALDTTAIE